MEESIGKANHKIPILNEKNYDIWSIKMRAYLRSQDMWDLVENGYDKCDKGMRMKDGETLCIILDAIPQSLVPCLGNAETAKEAWTFLKEKFCEAKKENVLRTSTQYSDNIEVGKEVEPSTSSPMTNYGYEFEVFLSFRGSDTRNGFTGHLYEALDDRGISTFIDSKKLEKGKQIHKLLEYIDKSKIIVVIFSEHYAQSRWCLKEVTRSVDSEKEIVPVFFGVEPSDVRNQGGTFESAFQEHESNKMLDQEEVKKWRQALNKIGNISGFNLKEANGDEAKLKHAIIERVSRTVNKQPLLVAKHPIGIETRVQHVKKMLENGNNGVHVVGIIGMGGLGKTTIANAVYNELAEGFNGSTCFLSNVRENAEKSNGLVSLQKQVIHKILKDENTYVSNVAQGQSLIKERANKKRVMLILDDVDSIEQIDALAGGRDWFGSGSVIIITTRCKDVLRAIHVKEDEIYMPEVLDQGQSRELFLQHAFNAEEPKGDYIELSNEVVAVAGGLPLTLEVIGSLLTCDMNVEEWKYTLEKLKNIPDEKVQQRLKLSYDKLQVFEQKIFLDISCFFIGEGKDYATYMWEACGWQPNYVIRRLEQRSLIKIDEKSGEFHMHDQIRDMGRAIVKDESSGTVEKQSRVWNSEDPFKLLKMKGTKDVEAIQLYCESEDKASMDIESFAAMSQLRMLQLRNVTLKGEYQHFPKNVRWLEWHPHDLESLPSSLRLDNIVVLDLSESSIHQLWIQEKVSLRQLKVLCLDDCSELITCPDFNQMPNLGRLSFSECEKMSGLHPSIGLLKKLTHLNLMGCKSLKELPETIYELTSLEQLTITCCQIITALPPQSRDSKSREKHVLEKLKILHLGECSNLIMCPDFTKMPNLEGLLFEECEKMSGLHPSIGLLKKLTYLNLLGCKSLKELPETIYELISLEQLNLWHCDEITTFPAKLGDSKSTEQHVLGKLKVLYLRGCSNLIMCPDFTKMPNLEKLSFNNCKKLSGLHSSIGLLQKLSRLDLSGCKSLKELPETIYELTSLEELGLSNCSKITTFPPQLEDSKSREKHVFGKLKGLDLDYCSNLIMSPDFTKMPNLERLSFKKCKKMNRLHPSIGHLKKLTHLNLSGCKSLKELQETIYELTSLENLDLSSCEIITTLPPQSGDSKTREQHVFGKLKDLCLKGCSNLIECPDFSKMPNLKRLSFEDCRKMMGLHPSIRMLKELIHLNLKGCESLKEFPEAIYELISLEKLDLRCSNFITPLPPQSGDSKSTQQHVLEKLKVLLLDKCSNRNPIMCLDFSKMPNLERLSFEDCENMTGLHRSIGMLKKLTYLNLKHCKSLKEFPETIYELTSLKELDLRYCEITTALPPQPGVSKSTEQLVLEKLEVLHLDYCLNLIMCPDFTKLPNLKTLSFIKCENISGLHPSIGCVKSLTSLDLEHCKSLKGLPQDIWQLTSLQELNLQQCWQISTLPPLPPSLIQLDLRGCSQLKELPQEIGQMISLEKLNLSNCSKVSTLPPLPPSLLELGVRGCSQLVSIADVSNVKGLQQLDLMKCVRLVDAPGIEQLVCLEELLLAGCRNLGDLFMERIKVAKFRLLNAFSIPGRLINDEWSYPHSITFILPKPFHGVMFLYVDKSSMDSIRSKLAKDESSVDSICSELAEDESSMDNICSELAEMISTPPVDQSIGSKDEVMIDSQQSRSVVQVDITTDDAQFSFSTFFDEWDGKSPTAKFEGDREMLRLAREGRFEENMVVRVTIDGCIILNGDFFTYNGYDDDIFYPSLDEPYVVKVWFDR